MATSPDTNSPLTVQNDPTADSQTTDSQSNTQATTEKSEPTADPIIYTDGDDSQQADTNTDQDATANDSTTATTNSEPTVSSN